MKTALYLFQTLFFLLLYGHMTTQERTDPEMDTETKSLVEALHLFNLNFEAANAERLAPMLTENYVHTNGNSAPNSKEIWLNYIRSRRTKIHSGELIIDKYDMTDIVIHDQKQGVIVTGVIHSRGSEKGVPFDKKFRVTHFWVLDNDQWKRAGFHDGVIQ